MCIVYIQVKKLFFQWNTCAHFTHTLRLLSIEMVSGTPCLKRFLQCTRISTATIILSQMLKSPRRKTNKMCICLVSMKKSGEKQNVQTVTLQQPVTFHNVNAIIPKNKSLLPWSIGHTWCIALHSLFVQIFTWTFT